MNNLAAVEDIEGLLEEPLSDQDKFLMNFNNKLMSSKLATWKVFNEVNRKRKKCQPINPVIMDSHNSTQVCRGNWIDDAVVQFEIFSGKHALSRCGVFETLVSTDFKNVLKCLPCSNQENMHFGQSYSSFSFRCPGSILDFEHTTCSTNQDEEEPWYLVNIGGKFFGEGVPVLLTSKVGSVLRFNILESDIRLFEPISFVHNYCCEHKIVAHSLRLASTDDTKRFEDRSVIEIRRKREKRPFCRICDQFNATYITYHDRLAPDNPCFYCGKCFLALHYDESGELIYSDFRLIPLFNSFQTS